jgi:hypothetical protein
MWKTSCMKKPPVRLSSQEKKFYRIGSPLSQIVSSALFDLKVQSGRLFPNTVRISILKG